MGLIFFRKNSTITKKDMARRASSKTNPMMILGVVAGIGVLAFGGMMVFGKKGKKKESLSGGTTLAIQSYVENANMLRGSEYMVEGKLDGKLGWSADGTTQLVSLQVDSPDGAQFLSIKVPPNVSKVNLEREQRYAFRVKIEQGGIAEAVEVRSL